MGFFRLIFAMGFIFFANAIHAQDIQYGKSVIEQKDLFANKQPLEIKFSASLKDFRVNTNDSTYLKISTLVNDQEKYDTVQIKMRARGNFRKNHCYYVPLKWKIAKKMARGTIFENNRKLKLVLPCLIDQNSGDEVVEEFLAYQVYELLSPYHFKTRLVSLDFNEQKGARTKSHQLMGFLIEDDDQMLKRIDGQKSKRKIHPLQHDDYTSIVNSFFQFLIANTDYSVRSQHNNKLVYVDGKLTNVPYDFDMSGLVNAPYATISGTQNLTKKISLVTQRAYKGYKRDSLLVDSVRKHFLSKKEELLNLTESLKPYFKKSQNVVGTKKFIESFYDILEDDRKYERTILRRARLN